MNTLYPMAKSYLESYLQFYVIAYETDDTQGNIGVMIMKMGVGDEVRR